MVVSRNENKSLIKSVTDSGPILLNTNCETQSHIVHWLSNTIFTWLSVRPSVSMVTSPFISTVWCSRQTISFLKANHLVMTLTEAKTYKKTKTHRHRQIQIQSASKTLCMLYFWKAGDSRIWNMILSVFLQWHRQRQRPNFMHYKGWIFFRCKYFSGLNIF